MIVFAAGVDWLGWTLASAALLASARLALRARVEAGGPRRWRIALLVLGQSFAALLLYLLLRSSDPAMPVHTLHVLTAHAPAAAASSPGERWVRLPEAPVRSGVTPVPDLATALRQFPQVKVVRIGGAGLEARDLQAAGARSVVFTPAPPAVGFTDWWAPQWLRQGEPLHVAGTAHAPAGSRIALLDPGGVRVDWVALQADGGFTLRANPRSAGLAEYRLHLTDTRGRPLGSSNLHVRIQPSTPTRLLLLAGGPDPELKFLRRWAMDHGARLQASIALGGGMRAGDQPFALDARTLGQADLLILDDRSWNALDGRRRDAVLTAVKAGMGLLLRASMPLAHTEAMGLRIRAASLPTAYRIPASTDAGAVPPPMLERPQLRIDNPGGPVLLRDDRGGTLAAWRAHGRGRIGAWLPGDTFRLALSGHGELHARQWSSVLGVLMRARSALPAPAPLRNYPGERTVLCGLAASPRVFAPASSKPLALVVDPRSHPRQCAAYWPMQPGWHRLVDASGERPFLVRRAGDDLVLRAADSRRATSALAAQSEQLARGPKPFEQRDPLPRWLLFFGWLSAMGAMWWFERSRHGRADRPTAA